MFQKNKIVIIIILLVIASGASYVWKTKNSPTSKNPIVNNLDTLEKNQQVDVESYTRDWKIYNENGLSFRYPDYFRKIVFDRGSKSINIFSQSDTEEYSAPDVGTIVVNFLGDNEQEKADIKKDYSECLKKADDTTCSHVLTKDKTLDDYTNQYLAIISSIRNIETGSSDFPTAEDFRIMDCSSHGGYITASTVYNENLKMSIFRTMGFCGLDVSLDNFYYFAPIILEDKKIIMGLRLFPQVEAKQMATKENFEQGDSLLEKQIKDSLASGKFDSLPEHFRKQIQDYEMLLKTIKVD